MASAVAVEASANAPRLPNNLGDDDHDITAKVGPIDSDDEVQPVNTVENGADGDDLEDDDLFGDDDGDDAAAASPGLRQLEDEELDSGDDEGRTDRVPQDVQEVEQEQQEWSFMDADIARHPIPEGTDNELYLLKVPNFIAIEPTVFNPKTFVPPTTDHHSKVKASEHFSSYKTAMSTIRWRRSPSNPADLQSNARINRWSDGSLTLQFASDPDTQFEINPNMLAPPQIAPKVPTPTSLIRKPQNYGAFKESFTYLVAPYEEANVMRVTNKLTTSLSVVPNEKAADTALEQLQNALAVAATRGRDEKESAISFIDVTEDPELIRQQEEQRFKERMRKARAQEKQEMRQRERNIGRGPRATGAGAGGLDDGPRRGGPPKPRQKSRRDWSDDEDYGRGPRTREDDYDEEDDFIAASDEEPEIVEDDDDEDDGIVESPPRGRRESPKRNHDGDDSEDNDVVAPSIKRRRRVIDDDDEDE